MSMQKMAANDRSNDAAVRREERLRRQRTLALDVLGELRNSLMVAFRFLDAALWRMDFEEGSMAFPLATDGSRMVFDSEAVLTRFADQPDEMMRDYLHSILHCIFRQPFDTDHPDRDAWQLACDMVAEASAMEMAGRRFPSADDAARKTALSAMEMRLGTLTPSKLYRVFSLNATAPELMAAHGVTPQDFKDWYALFTRDDHGMWSGCIEDDRPGEAQPQPQENPFEGAENNDSGSDGSSDGPQAVGGNEDPSDGETRDDGADSDRDEDGEGAAIAGPGSSDDDYGDVEDEGFREQDEKAWEEIAKRVEMDLRTYSSAVGDGSDVFLANLAHVNRRRVDFAAFLRRFASMGEDMRINDDEFDYLFYTYGFSLYGNMPLIEPLEYKESQRVREFVIAVDTSESCEGDLVKAFIRYTAGILGQAEEFGQEVNIHLIQCDNRVQSDTKITSLETLDALLGRFTVYGMGGTDFRPVFDYVERLSAEGEFEALKGLIYFTDGQGIFPDRMPPYETAFVFVDDGTGKSPGVPPWASKVVLDEDRIREMDAR